MKKIKNTSSDKWDTTRITPGTSFMKQLNEYLKRYFNKDNLKLNHNVNEIMISGSDEPGEGEHKIFDYIRHHKDYHKNTTTVIYGLDADLIMLTLNHLYISKQLYLFRETPHFIRTLDKTLNPHELYLIDIPKLEDEIINNFENDFTDNNDLKLQNEQKKRLVFDYILICFMLGNDFLPHFPSINIRTNGIHILINAYKEVFNFKNKNIRKNDDFLTDGKSIIWKNFRKFISYLADNELTYFEDEMKIRNKWESKQVIMDSNKNMLEENFISIPSKNREIEKYINPGDKGWENRYYKMLFNIDIDEERKSQICLNYLEGLEWTLKYYTSECPNWKWTYQYHYPPLLKDLLLYTPYFDTNFINNDDFSSKPVNEYVQLCYVLPRSSLHYLPKQLYDALMKHYSHLYKLDYTFSWSFCKYFWESHVNLPHIDINILEELVEDMNKQIK